MSVRTLSERELNRATLDRQLLLRRSGMDAAQAVEHLVGLQTQIPPNHYVALWSRLADFDAQAFSQRFEDREFVRISLQRSTIHTVTARDCLPLRRLLQPVQDRSLKGAFGRHLQGIDLLELAEHARKVVEQEPRTFNDLGKLLAELYPARDVQALGIAARNNLALVQVTPRGLWRQGGLAKHTTAEHWLGNAKAIPAMHAEELVLRYLAAFGPASVMDAQNWSGLTTHRVREKTYRPRRGSCRTTTTSSSDIRTAPASTIRGSPRRRSSPATRRSPRSPWTAGSAASGRLRRTRRALRRL